MGPEGTVSVFNEGIIAMRSLKQTRGHGALVWWLSHGQRVEKPSEERCNHSGGALMGCATS